MLGLRTYHLFYCCRILWPLESVLYNFCTNIWGLILQNFLRFIKLIATFALSVSEEKCFTGFSDLLSSWGPCIVLIVLLVAAVVAIGQQVVLICQARSDIQVLLFFCLTFVSIVIIGIIINNHNIIFIQFLILILSYSDIPDEESNAGKDCIGHWDPDGHEAILTTDATPK